LLPHSAFTKLLINRGIVTETVASILQRDNKSEARKMESGMFKGIKEFFANESGAVTVDWVVLTAAVVGLAMITYVGLAENTQAVTNATGATILTAQEFLTN
jgi:Flp pilus assembly pilin Flp